MMQHYWLTLYLRVALTLCMLSHDYIIRRTLENAGHRKRQVNIYVQDRPIFSASHNLSLSACLFHIKYNVEPDKISRIMYLIMCWSVTSRSSNGKWAIAWENLSFGIGFTEDACADPEVRTPSPWKFTSSILTCPPSLEKKLDPLPCKMLDPLWNLKKYSFP